MAPDSQHSYYGTASPPTSIPLDFPENHFHPTHRRTNTEYIPRPPLFEQGLDGSRLTTRPLYNRSPPSWADSFPRKKVEARVKIFSEWLQGKSDAVDLGVKTRLEVAPDTTGMMDASYLAPASMPHSRSHSDHFTGRFSFFSLRRQAESSTPDLPEPVNDDLLNLDIDEALAPATGASSEAAFDFLRDQADTLLRRMQEAYKQRTFALYQTLADKDGKMEELEETRVLVDQLRTQLDGMAAKALDQERDMQAMAEELEQEKRMRQQEKARRRSRSRPVRVKAADDDGPSLALQTPRCGGKRASHSTFTSDSGFESGDESVADSVFSHREGMESPTSTLAAPSPNISQIALSAPPPVAPTFLSATQKPLPTPAPQSARSSTYDRVMKGLSTRLGSSFVSSPSQCSICHGVPASEAWSVMGVLRDENRGLKTRLGELELVIDDCLGLVGP